MDLLFASMAAFKPWQALIDGIVSLLEWIFMLTMDLGVPSYVLAILIMTIIIKLLTQPLTNKQMRSTRKIQLLAPQVQEIQKRYATNPQKMNQLTMQLYKENNASPTAGCLPMLIQMPIIIAFYQSIRRVMELGPAYPEYFSINWIGGELSLGATDPTIVLPLLAALSTLLQQVITMGKLNDPQQKIMMWIMPVIFFFMVRSFPVLLGLYWIFYSIIGAVIMLPLKRKWAKEDKIQAEELRLAREAEEQQKAAKKAAAREAARKRAEERRQAQEKAAAKGGKPIPTREPSYFDMIDDPDYFNENIEEDVLEEEQAFRRWLREQGVERVHDKKFKEHPWSSEDEVVKMCYFVNGSEASVREMRAKYQKFMQQQAAELAAASFFGGRKKKSAKKEKENMNENVNEENGKEGR
ncbi:MAG: YidC/Oxa1 family membrane protein insertase [Bacillota bacterium]|nr:YidC/Oxa1 family membrane protein insertase [Bacillota bacterium]